jgi:hypothetical protein
VALYYLTTAGLLSTAFVSGALSISSGTLAAASTLLGQRSVSIGADPSRNFLVCTFFVVLSMNVDTNALLHLSLETSEIHATLQGMSVCVHMETMHTVSLTC